MSGRLLFSAVLVGLLPATARAQAWPVPRAGWRVRVERQADTPWPAKVGVVRVGTGNLDPLKCQAYVVTTNGAAVGCRVLWSAAGEPATVLFDSSSNAETYYIYLSVPPLPATMGWEPGAGVWLETRAKPPGPVDSRAQMLEAWKKSPVVQGRSVLSQLYLGLNPHGPARDFLALYRGQLRIEEAGEYALATVSGDASFVLVDGKPVAEWPGQHGPWEGRQGRYQGRVNLGAGLHLVEYYHAVGGNEPLAELAWRRPGRDRFEVVPAKAFGAVAQFAVTGVDYAPGNSTGLYVEWSAWEHTQAQAWFLVTMQFRAPGAAATWSFDDGAGAQGATVEHVFARPGTRVVKAVAGNRQATVPVAVRPNWWQLEEWPGETVRRQREALTGRDLAGLPVADLAYAVQYANILGDHRLLGRLGAACGKREADFTAEHATTFYALGLHYADATVREFANAERAFRVGLGLAGADATLRARVQLRLADLLAQRLGRAREAEPLLEKLPADLGGDEARWRKVLLADVALARGDAAAARAGYAAVTPAGDAKEEVRRRARLEGAQALLARGNLEEAERLLSQALWQEPLEKLNVDTGLAWLRLLVARQEWAAARQQCAGLLAVASADNDRAELLYELAAAEFALGRPAAGQEAVRRLVKELPYSAGAARAKDQWPGK